MTQPDCPRSYGQHRWKPGMTALQDVATMFEWLNPGSSAPENLGRRNYCPRHSVAPSRRRRVYL